MEPSIPVSISFSIANERRIPFVSLTVLSSSEKFFVRARRESERRFQINKKKKQRPEKEEEGTRRQRWGGEEGTRNWGNEKSWTGYSPRMPSWLLLFLDLRTDAPRMSCSPLLYGPAWGPHSMPRPITYEMRRSYCKSLSLSLSLSLSVLTSSCDTEPVLLKFVSTLSLKFIHSIWMGSIASTRDTHASHSVGSMTNEREKWTVGHLISRRSQEFI